MSFPSATLTALICCALAFPAFAQTLDLRINFQPNTSATPAGYSKDIGTAWSSSAGKGWVTEASVTSATHTPVNMTSYTRDRAVSGVEARLNTLIYMQPTSTVRAAYDQAVPNGTYKVVVSVGDPSFLSSTYSINVEGKSVISGFVPTSSVKWKKDSTTVTVTDGKITVDAKGGANTKLNYLHITTATAPPPAPVDLKFNFQNSTPAPPTGYLADYGQAYGLRTGANQGSGLRYGWVAPGAATPRDLTAYGRDRAAPADRRLATLMHMQHATGATVHGSWEIEVPNNWYAVTVSVGDYSNYDSNHKIFIEGQAAIPSFPQTLQNRFFAATKVVQVADGRLTIAASQGTNVGTNTKINYAAIQNTLPSVGRPSVSLATPSAFATGIPRDAAVTLEVTLPNGAIDAATLPGSVQLLRSNDNAVIPALVNTSGGGDVIVLQPTQYLDSAVGYRVEVKSSLQDVTGKTFLPFSSAFTTGAAVVAAKTQQVFEKISLGAAASGRNFTSLAIGPDGKLYAATITGEILRYGINSGGTLGASQIINSIRTANGTDRSLIGIVFDPAATASNLILWVTNNAPSLSNSPEWSGRLTRLSGPDLEIVQDYVVGFPRSIRDHLTNSLAFGPDGALYLTQGSLSAMGAPDNAWGMRSERKLSAALLRIDLSGIAIPPLNIQTEDGGAYDPFAPGAPVTIYASGVRNAYDLLWHSNGNLYAATNGSAAGGNSPSTPSPLPAACADRIDKAINGAYTGPAVVGLNNVANAQADYLYRIVPGGYYGHPNPSRCEWVLNGGNPTTSIDPEEEPQYALGTPPDRNWRGPHFVFGLHYSPNGTLEYKSGAFGGALAGKMMVARYSSGDDILVLTVGAGNVSNPMVLNLGAATLADPLDIVENPSSGDLYVTEYATKVISLLRPKP